MSAAAAKHILIVEDDEDIRDSLVELLEEHGYPTSGVSHGGHALDSLRASQERPCLIVLDLMMPVMDGREFRETQLKNPELAKIPVIVMSAYRDLDALIPELEPVGVLKKPLRVQELLDLVEQHCGNCHQEV